MHKTIDLAALTGGSLTGEIYISAHYWETRDSWGHIAEVTADTDGNYGVVWGYCKYRYYNRTWETYRFQSALHGALADFVTRITGVSPYKEIAPRDLRPMKSAAAETRRIARVTLVEGAKELFRRLKAEVDGCGLKVYTPLAVTADSFQNVA